MVEALSQRWLIFFGSVIALFAVDLIDVVKRFHYLRAGLAAILCFVAAKILLPGAMETPVGLSLAVIAYIIFLALAASWIFPRPRQRSEA
jgi:tellurite resistance protein TerC